MSVNSQIEFERPEEVLSSSTQPGPLPRSGHWLRRNARLIVEIALLLVFAALVRLPYFIRTVIDWDESTFILMADSLLNGHLPQTEYSAFKPPLAYVPYALFLAMFGQSIAAIRFGGLICVSVASVVIYLACRKRFGINGALIAGLCVSAFATVDRNCGCTMLEHIALVPLSFIVLVWPRHLLTARRGFGIGMLIGLAAALKTNFGGFILAPLCLLSRQRSLHGWKRTVWIATALMLGLSLPLVAAVPAYWLSGNIDLWWHSCILTNVSYLSHNAQSMDDTVHKFTQGCTSANLAGFALSWLSPILALLIACKGESKFNRERAFLIAMAMFAACGILTAVATGAFHIRHYFVVVVPFTAAMSGFLFQLALSSRRRVALGLTTLCLLTLSLSAVADEYANVWRTVVENRSTDTAYKVAEYLNSRNVYGQYIYVTRWNICYWMTGGLIPTRFIHPVHIGNREILSTLYTQPTDPISELRSIFRKKPVFVVTDVVGEQIRGDDKLKRALADELRRDYALERIIDDTGIFRRNAL